MPSNALVAMAESLVAYRVLARLEDGQAHDGETVLGTLDGWSLIKVEGGRSGLSAALEAYEADGIEACEDVPMNVGTSSGTDGGAGSFGMAQDADMSNLLGGGPLVAVVDTGCEEGIPGVVRRVSVVGSSVDDSSGHGTKVVRSATGAGDAFMAALSYAYLKGMDLPETVLFSAAAATLCVECTETVNASLTEEAVRERMKKGMR
jgi:hypothetical protein